MIPRVVRDQIGWFEPEQAAWVRARRPLHGVAVLVPRTRHQASELSERLRALGAEPLEAPTITIEPTGDPERLRACLARLADGAWDWLALTSANGVAGVWEQVEVLGLDARAFAGVRIAAVGPGTADALAGHGLRADVVPERFTTRGLADALVAGHQPARILLARADLATPALTEALDAAGWDTTEVEAYRTARAADLPPTVRERLAAGEVDVAAFASSSTVRNFVELLGGAVDPALRVAAIGPVTAATCRELGLRVDAEADPHDLDGLVAAVVAAARPG